MIFYGVPCTFTFFLALRLRVGVSFAPSPHRPMSCVRGVSLATPVVTRYVDEYRRPTLIGISSLPSKSDGNSDSHHDEADGDKSVGSGITSDTEVSESSKAGESSDDLLEITDEEKTIIYRIKRMFKGNKEDEKLTTKQRLAKMGLSALLSYGWVSNMSYSVSVSLAWYGFSKKTGLSPLAPGQWKPFLAVYAGFYVFNNFVRPIRVALAIGVTKYFDTAVNFIQNKTKLSRSASIGVIVFLANFCGTLAAMSFGVSLASAAAGVPIFPPKA